MRIRELISSGRPCFSFEFFPPKDEQGFDQLRATLASLSELKPSFVSVTWGAGGSTRRHGCGGLAPSSAEGSAEGILVGLGLGQLARDLSVRGKRRDGRRLRGLSLMAMKNPPHPGEVVRDAIENGLGLTVTAAAEGLGVSRKTLSQILNGRASITTEMAIRLEKGIGSSAAAWLRTTDAVLGRFLWFRHDGPMKKVTANQPAASARHGPDPL